MSGQCTQSVRVRNNGLLGMNFDLTGRAAGVVTADHTKYGTDANGTWELWVSGNGECLCQSGQHRHHQQYGAQHSLLHDESDRHGTPTSAQNRWYYESPQLRQQYGTELRWHRWQHAAAHGLQKTSL